MDTETIAALLAAAWGVWSSLVALCAELSRRIPDSRLGRLAGAVNLLARNTGQAVNRSESDGGPKKGPKRKPAGR